MNKIIHVFSKLTPKMYYMSKEPVDDDPSIELNSDKSPYRVYFGQDDWHVMLARSTLKKTSKYKMECWKPALYIDKEYTMDIAGLKQRLFPAKKKKFGKYELGYATCKSMVQELQKEIDRGQVLLHIHSLHKRRTDYFIRNLNLSKVPVVITQRGSAPPIFLFQKSKKLRHLFDWIIEELSYKEIDKFIIQSKPGFDFISNKYGSDRTIHLQDGLDFSQFCPLEIEKAKKSLGIDKSNKVLLYVGRYYSLKGVENILWAYRRLKIIDDSIQLILVGGGREDQLYNEAKNLGVNLVPKIPKKELVKYYSAADLFLMPISSSAKTFGGTGNVMIESIACNTPVYSSQLSHFLGTDAEKERIGVQFTQKDKMVSEIRYILNNPKKFIGCREIAQKYYDRDKNVIKMIKIYDELLDKYA